MRGLDDLDRRGKVLYVGISDAPAWWIAQANTLAHLRGWSPFVGLQSEYKPYRAKPRARVDPDGQSFERWLDSVVATG
jgi:aryl-alcohol dehydrogenase-like predicted oxidoreductase